jgi:hypothetical protein
MCFPCFAGGYGELQVHQQHRTRLQVIHWIWQMIGSVLQIYVGSGHTMLRLAFPQRGCR